MFLKSYTITILILRFLAFFLLAIMYPKKLNIIKTEI